MEARLAKKKVARIQMDQCLAWKGEPCDACYQVCPGKDFGLLWEDWGPVILAPNCKGCSLCIQACKERNGRSFIKLDSTETLTLNEAPGGLTIQWLSKRLKKPTRRPSPLLKRKNKR